MSTTNNIPNKLKQLITELRNAMGRGQATAMVGSGFSFNADNGDKMPSWNFLGITIENELLRAQGKLKEILENEQNTTRHIATSDILLFADKYKALVKRGIIRKTLDDLILEITPDEGVVDPGNLHIQLLSLPWNDVFTTNYDTLLERAQIKDQKNSAPQIKKHYNVIKYDCELKLAKPAKSRRLIKLHGSFPDTKPFLLAEDDYRTYPETHPLFVQTVRQAMVENILCLIGFSGDDPNFKKWMGWVRDILKGEQPQIYIIVFNDPDQATEALFDEYNVIPINISPLALTQFYSTTDSIKSALSELFNLLHADDVEEPLWVYFEKNSSFKFSSTPNNDNCTYAVEFMRERRSSYPGWIYPPLEVLNNFHNNYNLSMIKNFNLYLRYSDGNFTLENFLVIYEYAWALHRFCCPLEQFHEFINKILNHIYSLLGDKSSLKKLLADIPDEIRVDSTAVIRCWQELACILLGTLRRYKVQDEFNEYIKKLKYIQERYPNEETNNWTIYHKILWDLETFNPTKAGRQIDEWMISGADPYWKTRKAILLLELERIEEGHTLLQESLFELRQLIREKGETSLLLSSELWTERFLEVFKKINIPSKTSKEQTNISEDVILSRAPVLRRLSFHPFQILQGLIKKLHDAANLRPFCEPLLKFEYGKIDSKINFQNGMQPGIQEVYSFLGLIEQAAFPARIDSPRWGSLNTNSWLNCAVILLRVSHSYPILAQLFIARTSSLSLFKSECILFSRFSLAFLARDDADNLLQLSLKRVNELLHSNTSKSSMQISSETYFIEFFLCLIKRLCLRVSKKSQIKILKLLFECYKNDNIFANSSLANSFCSLFHTVLQNFDKKLLTKNISDLFALKTIPTAQKNGIVSGLSYPIDFYNCAPILKPETDGTEWEKLSLQLISDLQYEEKFINETLARQSNISANSGNLEIDELMCQFHKKQSHILEIETKGNLLRPYWSKFVWLEENNLLTENTLSKITGHLWSKQLTTNLPEIPGLQPWFPLIHFPQGTDNQLWGKYKKHVFKKMNTISCNKAEFLYNSLNTPYKYRQQHTFSDEELVKILDCLHSIPLPTPTENDPVGLKPTDNTLEWIAFLLIYIVGPRISIIKRQCKWIKNWLDMLIISCHNTNTSSVYFDVIHLLFAPAQALTLAEKIRSNMFLSNSRTKNALAFLSWKRIFNKYIQIPANYEKILGECFKYQTPPNSFDILYVIHAEVDIYGKLTDQELCLVLGGLELHFSALDYKYFFQEERQGILSTPKQLPLLLPEWRRKIALFIASITKAHPNIRTNKIITHWIKSLRNDPISDISIIFK